MIQTEISADARAIADMLNTCPIGEIVTLGAISEAIGRDITACRHILATARRVALRETAAVFSTEPRAGLRRLSAERATEVIGPGARRHIRKAAGRAKRALIAATEGANDLSEIAQRRRAAEINALGLMEHIARDASVKASDTAPMKPQPIGIVAQNLLARISGQAGQ
ncbi:MAG: hypothetical protein INF64_00995 [Roseomonas sp.]|nr:hypothetical protein [Roseomonas sp.]